MKYFLNAIERSESGHENFTEFQIPDAETECWDAESLYLSEDIMAASGFREFWQDCMQRDIVFDMDTISMSDLCNMGIVAREYSETVRDILAELSQWAEPILEQAGKAVGVVREIDRALARCREERECYPVPAAFYKEVQEIVMALSFGEREKAYEQLLKKYNLPGCFYPCGRA